MKPKTQEHAASGEAGQTSLVSGANLRALISAACVLALGVIWCTVVLHLPVQSVGSPLADFAVPYVYQHVVIAHLLGVIPLMFWLSSFVTRKLRGRGIAVVIMLLVGAVVALVAARAAPPVSESLSGILGGDIWLADAIRLVFAGVMMLPWCFAAATVLPWPNDGGRMLFFDGLIVVLLAYLPALHVHQVIERKLLMADESRRNDQFATELTYCRQLQALGQRDRGGVLLASYAAELGQRVAIVRNAVESPLPASPTDADRLERARRYYQLGEFDAARQALGQLPKTNPQAAVRIGLMSELSGNWRQAAADYAAALTLLAGADQSDQSDQTDQSDRSDRSDLHLMRLSLERRVNNLRRLGRYREAEQELRAALERWPAARDAVLLQLGYHFKMAGRHHDASEYFHQAAALNPQYDPVVQRELMELRNQAEGCIFGIGAADRSVRSD
ncbi:MAG: tetratricopeptide repeat protein [Planctomycetales bacterium]|nr:tetratricopeptide repeat protein [Planctomycetales bacterium]